MRKSIEMKKQLDTLKNEISTLQAAGKIFEAHDKLTELKSIKNAIEVQEALEEDEQEKFFGSNPKPTNTPITNDKKAYNRVFNKQLLGLPLLPEEKSFATNEIGTPGQVGATPAKGGYLLRQEQYDRIIEYRRGLVSLKSYCEVIPVNSRSGSMPTTTDDSSELVNFDELSTIKKGDIDFGNIAYEAKSYGEIVPVSNELLNDIDVDLVSVIGRRFSRKGVRTENKKILALAQAITPTAITDYKGIKTALNVSLDPDLLEGATITTNQDGFDYLDKIVLDNGLPLLQPVLTDKTKRQIGGYEIIVLSNAQLANAGDKIPFFVGNMYEFVKFFDREQISLGISIEAGFTQNATFLRAIERFDVKPADTGAMYHLQLPTTAVAMLKAQGIPVGDEDPDGKE